MRAVNLLPAQPRTHALGVSFGAPFAGVCAGLALVVAGTAVYVVENNQVNARKADLAELSIGVSDWNAVAQSYARFTDEAQRRATQLSGVQQLVAARYDWENLLAELAGQLPRNAQLSSITASSPNTSSASAEPTTTQSGSGLQLMGCATSESAVAATMVRLHRVTGVSSVQLQSTSTSSTGGSVSSGSGGCSLPVTFQMTLDFASSVTPGASSETSTTPAAS